VAGDGGGARNACVFSSHSERNETTAAALVAGTSISLAGVARGLQTLGETALPPAALAATAPHGGETAAAAPEGEPQSGEKPALGDALPRRPLMVSMPLFWQISINGETAFACAALCCTPPASKGTFRRFTGVLEEESRGVLPPGVPSANTWRGIIQLLGDMFSLFLKQDGESKCLVGVVAPLF